jgi:hypothetical protein
MRRGGSALHRLALEDLDRAALVLGGDLLRPPGEVGGGDHVRGQVLELAGPVRRLGRDPRRLDLLPQPVGIPRPVELEPLDRDGAVLGLSIAVEAIGREHGSLDEGGRDTIGRTRPGDLPGDRAQLVAARLLERQRRHDPGPLRAELLPLAEADGQYPLRPPGPKQGELAVGRPGVRRAGSGVEGARQRLVLE